MAGDREVRSTRNQQVNYKDTSKSSKAPRSIATSGATTSTASSSTINVKSKSSGPRPQLTTVSSRLSTVNSRLSTSNQSPTAQPALKEILEAKINALESRLNAIETSFNQVLTENAELRLNIENLQSDFSQLKDQKNRLRSSNASSVSSISLEQQDLNATIVIRGVDVKDSIPAAELTAIYEGIRSHLGISDVAELAPISVSLISPNTAKPNSSLRPI